jgi:hypothetical protein
MFEAGTKVAYTYQDKTSYYTIVSSDDTFSTVVDNSGAASKVLNVYLKAV